jgi:hypothetical protein
MAKRPETPEVLRYVERQRYNSPEWHKGSAPRSGFGGRVITDPNVSTEKWDRLPNNDESSKG